MLDTGAPVSLVRKDVFDQAQVELVPWAGGGLVGVEGTPLVIHGIAAVEIGLLGKLLPTEVIVARSLKAQAILGWREMGVSSTRGYYTCTVSPFQCR